VELVLASTPARRSAHRRLRPVRHGPGHAHRELTQHFPRRARSNTTPTRSPLSASRRCATSPREHARTDMTSSRSASPISANNGRFDRATGRLPTAPSSGRTAHRRLLRRTRRVWWTPVVRATTDSCSILTSRRPRCAGSSITVTWTTSTHRASPPSTPGWSGGSPAAPRTEPS